MKLQYEAPEILFEDFSLSVSIAAGCEFKTSIQGEDQCGYNMEGMIVFTQGVISGCEWSPPPGNNTICYHNPYESNNLYIS